MHILLPETDNCPSWISGRERMTVENISWSISTKECCRLRRGLNPRPPGLQSDGASNWATEAGRYGLCQVVWACAGWSESAHFAHVLRHFFAWYGLCQAKKCLRTCTKWADSDHPAHAQTIIRAFAKAGTINWIIDKLIDKFHKNDYHYKFANNRSFDFCVGYFTILTLSHFNSLWYFI